MSLEIAGVHKRFGPVHAVAGVNLEVARGEFFALLGPSGCGKTTLLRIIAGIYPLDAGTVLLNKRDITRLPMHRRNLAMVFQNYALFPHLTVFENVAFGLRSRKVRGEVLRRRVASALSLVRLEALAERYPVQLSGGQQQRVALARAVAVEPDLLLLDEPLSNLDARLRDEMRVEIRELQRRLGITTVFVTHDIGEAFAMADRIAVMRNGEILQLGRAAEIYNRPVSWFVANFVGPVNKLSILAIEENAVRLDGIVDGGARVCLPRPIEDGEAANLRLLLRPECLHIDPVQGLTDNNFVGVLEHLVFLGGVTEARVRVGSSRLLVVLPSAQAAALRVGGQVTVGWSSSDESLRVIISSDDAINADAAAAANRLPVSRAVTIAIFVAPLCLVLVLGFVWPLWRVLVNSFHLNTPQGIDYHHWSLANYWRLLDAHYLTIVARTVRISVAVTAISALLAYPVAIFIARRSARMQSWLILAYLMPWLVNTVVKALGWTILLRNNGVFNTALVELGIISSPLRLMLSEAGVILALIPGHFLFVLLPLWTAVSSLDPALVWAAGTLGAAPTAAFRRVVLPLTLPALIVGLTINFIMNMTAFAIPMLLGGVRNEVASMLAYQVNLVTLDWPFGGALAVALLGFSLLLIWAGQRLALLAISSPGGRT